jgi:hypothetical protein
MCAQMTRAIVNKGHSFFGGNPVTSDFAAGTTFNFSVSYLEGITDAVGNANPIQQAIFPRKWWSQFTADAPYGGPPLGPPPTQWRNPAPAPTSAPAHAPSQAPSPTKEDLRHPAIKLLIDPYHKYYDNFVDLSEVLTLSGKRMTDLPTLPQYCQSKGQPFLCWYSGSVLGKCFQGMLCKYYKGHLKKGGATDAFVGTVSECISKGVLYYTNLPARAGSPRNKHKGGGEPENPDSGWG